jgi:DNA-binding transcriptional MerR regulator
MALKVFKGFSLDMAADLSGLDKSEIKRLRNYGIVSPPRTKQGFAYTFANLLMLRLIKQLRLNDVNLKDIRNAHEYLSELDPNKNLREFKLYIRTDSKEIVYFGEKPDNRHALINASKFGQLLLDGLLVVIPVGKQLEQVRQNVIDFDRELDQSMRSTKVIPLDKVLARYGLA